MAYIFLGQKPMNRNSPLMESMSTVKVYKQGGYLVCLVSAERLEFSGKNANNIVNKVLLYCRLV